MKNGSVKGFTLLELLVVIAIIGILAATLIPNLLTARQSANRSAGQSFTRNTFTVLETMRETNGVFLAGRPTDCAVGDPFPVKPGAVISCTITYSTSRNDYLIVVALSESLAGNGNKFYNYFSNTAGIALASTAATPPTGF